MRADCFKVNQADTFIKRIAQQVEQATTVKVMHPQCRQVTLLALPQFRGKDDGLDRRIDICGGIVVELFVLPGKATRLQR